MPEILDSQGNPFPKPEPRKPRFSDLKNILTKVRKHFIFIAGGLAILAGIFANLSTIEKYIEEKNWFAKAPAPLFENDSTYHIMLLPFGSFSNCNQEELKFHVSIQNGLNRLIKSEHLSVEVKTFNYINSTLKPNQLDSLGKKNNANLVLWGDSGFDCNWDSTYLNVKYHSLIPFEFEEGEEFQYRQSSFPQSGETGLKKFHKMHAFDLLENGQLAGSIEDIIHSSLGIQAFFNEDFEASLNFWRKIKLEEKPEYSHIWYFMGLVMEYNKEAGLLTSKNQLN